MATSPSSVVNDKIKKKLLALSENIRRNLLLASSDVQRKFILEERDLLSILVLAIQYLHKPSSSTAPSSTTDQKQTQQEQQQQEQQQQQQQQPQQQQQQQQPPSTTPTTNNDETMGKSGGKAANSDGKLDTTEKLRKELLQILESTSFDSDSKSWLLLDCYNRYNSYTTRTKEQEILDKHLNKHPNVLVGGGGNNEGENTNDSSDNKQQSSKETNAEPPTTSSSETIPTNQQTSKPTNKEQTNNPAHIWINDALRTVSALMKSRVNVIFIENLELHARKLQNFLTTKGTFDKENNRIIAPHNRFFLKKDSLYFKTKSVKGLQYFDLATLLACVSFSKSKLFRFLQYRFKRVRAFSKVEKQCIHIFLNTCPISKRRIPCSSIRNLAQS